MHRALQTQLHRPSAPPQNAPGAAKPGPTRDPPHKGQPGLGQVCPCVLTSSFWPPGSPSSPSVACREPAEPFLVSQRSFLSRNSHSPLCLSGQAASPQLSLGLSPLFLQPLPHLLKLSSWPGLATFGKDDSIPGRPAPLQAEEMCYTCKPWQRIIPCAWHWAGCVSMQNPDLGSQGLLGHLHTGGSPETVGGGPGQGARRGWGSRVGSTRPSGLLPVPKAVPQAPRAGSCLERQREPQRRRHGCSTDSLAVPRETA